MLWYCQRSEEAGSHEGYGDTIFSWCPMKQSPNAREKDELGEVELKGRMETIQTTFEIS